MKKMRRAFGLIAAIFFIVLVATTAITALSIATMTARDTNNAHNREQAVLLAQSATEYAVLAMQQHVYPTTTTDNAECLNQIDITYPSRNDSLFDINVTINYLDANMPARCNRASTTAFSKTTGNAVTSHAAIIDVVVTSTPALDSPRIRYHRRTIQKP
ncbi:type II secretion system protein [Campylobacter sp. JMF_06 NA1]|uniref:type II secretion system protein n=1 Tax=Campylobacter sp. JMF_06 NA1 TaxID=2983823 RepID=UPI0022E9CB81|nr:type II secretion system protein [Campylobacter sp. JMF_06 NA1]MDA3077416.1 type II secretion system protein [Campylobacter sp. JMF_06 NA1]